MAYRWLIANEIIEEADAIIASDGTTACPSDGSEFDHRTHVYTGPDPALYVNGNILDYRMRNHARAKILAPIFKAILIDDVTLLSEGKT